MEGLHIDATEDTPRVHFSPETGRLEISGRSLPENALEFYEPVMVWVERYFETNGCAAEFHLTIEYCNSASTRYMFNMLMDMEEKIAEGHDIKVFWYYRDEDEMIRAKGEELAGMLDLPFERVLIN